MGIVNKVVLITGGSRGLGAEFVGKLAEAAGYRVCFTYLNSREEAEELVARYPGTAAFRCDQRDESSIAGCVSKIGADYGKIDVLVNNACPSFRPCDFLSSGWNQFQELMDVKVKGAYIFTREAAKVMKEHGGGKIINILSTYVFNVPPEKISFYITALYALQGLSRAAAAELGKFNITVNMISPGLMVTGLSDYLPRKYLDVYSQKHPMKRMTRTEDVADTLQFLLSEKSGFLNGVNIPVNGGEVF